MLREIILHQQNIAYLATDIVMKEKTLFGIGHPTVPFVCQLPYSVPYLYTFVLFGIDEIPNWTQG